MNLIVTFMAVTGTFLVFFGATKNTDLWSSIQPTTPPAITQQQK